MEYITEFFQNTWAVYFEAAPFLLLGFVTAGFLHQYMPADFIQKYLTGEGLWPIVKAAVIGTPVPLCSCGVVPVGLSLNEKGLARGPTTSFLISTPENGVDSISLSVSLFGGVFTVVRVFFSLVVAVVTGLFVHVWGERQTLTQPVAEASGCCGTEKSSAGTKAHKPNGIVYILNDFLPKTVSWLMIGFGLSGVITTLIPVDFFHGVGSGVNILLAAVVGVPIYVCASASTPIALSLYLSGMSPGACLVFLLTGPATNATNIPLYIGQLGKKTTAMFYVGVFMVSMACGLLVDIVFTRADFATLTSVAEHGKDAGMLANTSVVILSLALVYAAYWRFFRKRPS